MSEDSRSSAIRTYDCLGVLFFFFGLSRHRCLLCRRLILILNFPFKVITVLPILLMKEPGIMMLFFYDIPMFISSPSTFLLFFLFYHEFCLILRSQLQTYIP